MSTLLEKPGSRFDAFDRMAIYRLHGSRRNGTSKSSMGKVIGTGASNAGGLFIVEFYEAKAGMKIGCDGKDAVGNISEAANNDCY